IRRYLAKGCTGRAGGLEEREEGRHPNRTSVVEPLAARPRMGPTRIEAHIGESRPVVCCIVVQAKVTRGQGLAVEVSQLRADQAGLVGVRRRIPFDRLADRADHGANRSHSLPTGRLHAGGYRLCANLSGWECPGTQRNRWIIDVTIPD